MATRIDDRQFASLEEALTGLMIPHAIREPLVLVEIPFVDFADEEKLGQLVLHRSVVEDVLQVFTALHAMRFPIARMIPVAAYGWSDDASMAANNSSAFNYRFKTGKDELSDHSYGTAVDINPMQNPFIGGARGSFPAGAIYDPAMPGTVTLEIARLFKERGWTWGGDWISIKDYQHFEKPL